MILDMLQANRFCWWPACKVHCKGDSQVEQFLLARLTTHNLKTMKKQVAAEWDVVAFRSLSWVISLNSLTSRRRLRPSALWRLEATRMKKVVHCAKSVLARFESKICKSVIEGLRIGNNTERFTVTKILARFIYLVSFVRGDQVCMCIVQPAFFKVSWEQSHAAARPASPT